MDVLVDIVRRSADDRALTWLERSLEKASGPDAERELPVAFAGAGRRLARFEAIPTPSEIADLRLRGAVAFDSWRLDRIARAALLMTALEGRDEDHALGLIGELFRRGDNEERCALLQALVLLPTPARYRETAVEACRTNVQDVFEAVACENAYPAAYFTDAEFNQMVLKALFLGVPLARVEGLAKRRSRELVRMAEAYARERRAAGRSVPGDLALLDVEPTES